MSTCSSPIYRRKPLSPNHLSVCQISSNCTTRLSPDYSTNMLPLLPKHFHSAHEAHGSLRTCIHSSLHVVVSKRHGNVPRIRTTQCVSTSSPTSTTTP